MKAIMVMFDSLNRHMLPNYGCDWIKAPNFKRLGEKTVTFDNCYVGSMPCIPARRELHTGRYNFLHRSWGPLEPFDDSMPELLKNAGIYTHLTSDHQHYWEDGGATYHTRYSSWEISRGQEGDPWKGDAGDIEVPDSPFSPNPLFSKKHGVDIYSHDAINRRYMSEEPDMPQAKTFRRGIEFIEQNKGNDNWFLQIETFDPHEPFFAPEHYRNLYPDADYNEEEFDWPPYAPVMESPEVVAHGKKRYAALLSMCDHYLGKVIDTMDKYNMWEDTMLIVNTDHGFLLGEHDWWAKSIMPVYNEIAHIPFFVWDPRVKKAGQRCEALTQTIDIAPTLLEYFGVPVPERMEGRPLYKTMAYNEPIRETAMFGYHGGHINITDGEYVYMLAPGNKDNRPLYEYTLMPTHMRNMFNVNELQNIQLEDGFFFTKGCTLMKIESMKSLLYNPVQYGTKLFDVVDDPAQTELIQNEEVELKLINAIREKMIVNDAPDEQFERMGIIKDRPMDSDDLRHLKANFGQFEYFDELKAFNYEAGAFNQITTLLNLTKQTERKDIFECIKFIADGNTLITKKMVLETIDQLKLDEEEKQLRKYFVHIAGRTS